MSYLACSPSQPLDTERVCGHQKIFSRAVANYSIIARTTHWLPGQAGTGDRMTYYSRAKPRSTPHGPRLPSCPTVVAAAAARTWKASPLPGKAPPHTFPLARFSLLIRSNIAISSLPPSLPPARPPSPPIPIPKLLQPPSLHDSPPTSLRHNPTDHPGDIGRPNIPRDTCTNNRQTDR